MTEKTEQTALTKTERTGILDAIIAKHGSHLLPGEALSFDLTQDKTHTHLELLIKAPDDSEQVEMEVAVLVDDNEQKMSKDARFDLAIDFVDSQLVAFFENDRFERFHDEWMTYDFSGSVVRFRGAMRKPKLENLADQWIAAGGDPSQTDE